MVVVTISDIISIVLLSALFMGIVVIIIYGIIADKINKKFKKNCFKCKYYELNNVAGSGGICWYKCTKNDYEDRHDFNDMYQYRKCDLYEEKDD